MSQQFGRRAEGAPPPLPAQLSQQQQAQAQAAAQTPQGMQLTGVKPYYNPVPSTYWGLNRPTPTGYMATYAPKPASRTLANPASYFGPQKVNLNLSWDINAEAPPNADYSAQNRAVTGFGLATTTAVGVGIPLAGATGLGFVGGGEAIKYGTTGQHLTVEEAVGLASVGESVYAATMLTRSALQPRVQAKIDASYRAAVENQQLYRPTLMEKIMMGATGATSPHLAQEIVAAGEAPPLSFKMLQQGAISADEEAYFWDNPTPKSSEVYATKTGSANVKTWIGEHLIKSVSGGLSYSLIQQDLQKPKLLERKLPYIPSAPEITGAVDVQPIGMTSSGLALEVMAPKQQTRLTQLSIQRSSLVQESTQAYSLAEELAEVQQQRTSLIPIEMMMTRQTQVQVQKTQQGNIFSWPSTPTMLNPPYFGGGSQGRESPFYDFFMPSREVLGKRTRHYPIMSAKRVLGAFF